MKILLHTCCGVCCGYPLNHLRNQNFIVHLYFYNPNIHPYTEFLKRLEAVKVLAVQKAVPLIEEDIYDIEEYFRNVVFRESQRCLICYDMRLLKTASVAKSEGFDSFTTTLLISPYQKHQLIRQIGEEIAKRLGINFYYQDFRPNFSATVDISKEYNLYRQNYCGCIYSEKERFEKRQKNKKQQSLN